MPIPIMLGDVDAAPIWTNVDPTATIGLLVIAAPTTLMELTPTISPVVSATKITVDPIPTVELIVVDNKFTSLSPALTIFDFSPKKALLPSFNSINSDNWICELSVLDTLTNILS